MKYIHIFFPQAKKYFGTLYALKNNYLNLAKSRCQLDLSEKFATQLKHEIPL